MKENIRGIIFDLDGVLVFTDQFHYRAWKQLADELGVYFDEQINNRLRGVSRMDSLEIILEQYHGAPLAMEKKQKLAEQKNDTYRKLLATMTPDDVSEEVRKTLATLRSMGLKLAIGSSSKNAGFILRQVDLIQEFDAVSDGNSITRSKPDPEVFLKGAEYLHLDPSRCVVVEDAYAGIDAAKAGGMIAIAMGDAAGYEKADYRLERFGELIPLAEKLIG